MGEEQLVCYPGRKVPVVTNVGRAAVARAGVSIRYRSDFESRPTFTMWPASAHRFWLWLQQRESFPLAIY